MEILPKGQSSSHGSKWQPRQTTVEDMSGDILDLITKKLPLLEHYKGWAVLMAPYSLGVSPLNGEWFLKKLDICCKSPCFLDPQRSSYFEASRGSPTGSSNSEAPCDPVSYSSNSEAPYGSLTDHGCFLHFFEKDQGKEQKIYINLENGTTTRLEESCPVCNRWTSWFTGDKGLLFFSLHRDYGCTGTLYQDTFLVLNPLSSSISILPSISSPLPSYSIRSGCRRVPLRLMVDTKWQKGLKSSQSTSYKGYVMEIKDLYHLRHRRVQKVKKRIFASCSFRIFVYDSITRSWEFTGMQWLGGDRFSPYTQIFPMTDGSFYVSTTSEILYKFQDRILVGKVKPPCRKKPDNGGCISMQASFFNPPRVYHGQDCGCASTTLFEAEGKMFFFKQTSWVGLYGPNCISATLWELDNKAMIWRKLPVISPHRLEVCCKQNDGRSTCKSGLTFRYQGMLLVVHCEGPTLCYVAAFDISKKTWCKVPEKIMKADWWSKEYLGGNFSDLDRFVFQPNIYTAA